jgi:hypothetical protein
MGLLFGADSDKKERAIFFFPGRTTRPVEESDGDRIDMLSVMMSQGEVMVIVIITAVVVFIIARKRRAK